MKQKPKYNKSFLGKVVYIDSIESPNRFHVGFIKDNFLSFWRDTAYFFVVSGNRVFACQCDCYELELDDFPLRASVRYVVI